MATNLITALVLFMTVSCSCAKVSFIQSQKVLLYSGSEKMNLTDAKNLCHSIGGELPVPKNKDQDLPAIASLTIESVWVGVKRIEKPVKPKDPTQSIRHYTWSDGSVIPESVVDEIGSCNTTCCSLRLKPMMGSHASVKEVNCNDTALPLCVIQLTIPNMAKLLKASDSFRDESDKVGLATHVLPEFTSQLNDQMEKHKKVTNAVMFSLLAVGLCLLMLLVVTGIMYLREREGNPLSRKKNRSPEYGSPSATNLKKENGKRLGSKEEEGIFLPEIGEISNNPQHVLSSEI